MAGKHKGSGQQLPGTAMGYITLTNSYLTYSYQHSAQYPWMAPCPMQISLKHSFLLHTAFLGYSLPKQISGEETKLLQNNYS